MSKPEWQSIGEQFLTSYFGGNDSNVSFNQLILCLSALFYVL